MLMQPETQADCYERVRQVLYRAIDDVNAQGTGAPIERSPDTVLVGGAGRLDSFGLLNFVMSVEEHAGRAFPGRPFQLLDAITSLGEAPATVDALAKSIGDRLVGTA